MKDIEKIKKLLSQAVALMEDNIEAAENVDLTYMCQVIDEFVDILDEIGDFEAFDYEDEEPEYDGAGFGEEDRMIEDDYMASVDQDNQRYDDSQNKIMKYTLIEAIKHIEQTTNKVVASIGYEDGSGCSFNYTTMDEFDKPKFIRIPNKVGIFKVINKF